MGEIPKNSPKTVFFDLFETSLSLKTIRNLSFWVRNTPGMAILGGPCPKQGLLVGRIPLAWSFEGWLHPEPPFLGGPGRDKPVDVGSEWSNRLPGGKK